MRGVVDDRPALRYAPFGGAIGPVGEATLPLVMGGVEKAGPRQGKGLKFICETPISKKSQALIQPPSMVTICNRDSPAFSVTM
jgi:hypothetical protein